MCVVWPPGHTTPRVPTHLSPGKGADATARRPPGGSCTPRQHRSILEALAMPSLDCAHHCAQDIETQDGQLVCGQCAPTEHVRCDGCEQWYPYGESCRDCVT